MSTIDERAIGALSFIANLSKHISAKTNDKAAGQDLSKYFPALYWVVRDFALELGGKDKPTVSADLVSCFEKMNDIDDSKRLSRELFGRSSRRY